MHPKVSIAIPVYKSAFLKQAIDSVLGQTFADWELIIVNDASPEPVSEIVEEYTDPRIRYYANEINIGADAPAENWNKCLGYARGEFFALLCDDDSYDPKFVQTMLELSVKYPDCSVFRSRVRVVNSKNEIITYYPSSPEWEPCEEYIWHILKGLRAQTISEFFYRTDWIRSKKGFDSFPKAWCSDLFSIFRFSEECGIATSRDVLVSFRDSGTNISTRRKFVREKIIAHKIFTSKLNEFLESTSFELKDTLIDLRRSNERVKLSGYLADASFRDFMHLYIHRNSNRYRIPNLCFAKAMELKFARFIKRIIK